MSIHIKSSAHIYSILSVRKNTPRIDFTGLKPVRDYLFLLSNFFFSHTPICRFSQTIFFLLCTTNYKLVRLQILNQSELFEFACNFPTNLPRKLTSSAKVSFFRETIFFFFFCVLVLRSPSQHASTSRYEDTCTIFRINLIQCILHLATSTLLFSLSPSPNKLLMRPSPCRYWLNVASDEWCSLKRGNCTIRTAQAPFSTVINDRWRGLRHILEEGKDNSRRVGRRRKGGEIVQLDSALKGRGACSWAINPQWVAKIFIFFHPELYT